jgi:hypothetical protein
MHNLRSSIRKFSFSHCKNYPTTLRRTPSKTAQQRCGELEKERGFSLQEKMEAKIYEEANSDCGFVNDVGSVVRHS